MPAAAPAVPAGRRGDRDAQRDLGAFYTPAPVAAHMAGLLRGLGPDSRILEPSGGDGRFVSALVAAGAVEAAQLDVWDLDEACRSGIEALGATFVCQDTLLDADHTATYSHVIGNPPYLNKQSAYIKAHRAALRRRFGALGVNDTYALFIAAGLDLLVPGGQLSFVVSDTFLTLGIHERLRTRLLTETTLQSITLLPAGTFAGAAVRTAILDLDRAPAPAGHRVAFVDVTANAPGDFAGETVEVPQDEFAANPGAIFAFRAPQRAALRAIRRCPSLLDVVDGGLGMWTNDNGTYLGVVDHGTGPLVPPRPGQAVVPAADVDGTRWRHYHKRGGTARWWRPAEHCVRWDGTSRGVYEIPESAHAGTDADGTARDGIIVSGVATRLTARRATPGALWESNKAFGLFPKDPAAHPVGFLLAVFNSAWYDQAAKALNHTVSLQIRDLRRLPLLPFTRAEIAELATLGDAAVDAVRAGGTGDDVQGRIDALVDGAAARAGR